jgi:nitrile hydratase accessory protein
MTPDPAAVRAAIAGVPTIPHEADAPVFREPWEARAFAMAVSLHAAGLFTWKDWAAALAEEIARGDGSGEAYYLHWLATLEKMVAGKGAATEAVLARYRQAWDAAADRTPHGKPIELTPEDFES